MNWFRKRKFDYVVSDMNVFYSPANGRLIDIKEVSDKTFSSGIMGWGLAIIPTTNIVSSPVEGEIILVFPTKHAIGIKGKNGSEIILHIGIDTVELKGEYFDCRVKVGDQVRVGQDLVEVQMNKIKRKGYDTTTMVVITNPDEYNISRISDQHDVSRNDELLRIVRKEPAIENSKTT